MATKLYFTSPSTRVHFQLSESSNPFRGASSYEEADKQYFYGRDEEKNELMRIISQNTLSLLYAKSGVGKSSLLKAGIIPVVKGMRSYFPVYIRISDSLITEEFKTFSEAVVQLIRKAAKAGGIIVESDSLLRLPSSLTEFLYLSDFFYEQPESGHRKKCIPILFFDQFEEIFSLEFKKSSVKELLLDLSNIIEGRIPDYLLQAFTESQKPESVEGLFILKDKLQSSNKWYRLLFSFREEYLPCFESLKEEIPSVFYTNGRFHLDAFSLNTAIDVIHQISLEGIEIDKGTAGHITHMLSKQENELQILTPEVQPFLLSLVCKSLYPQITGPRQNQQVLKAIIEEDASLIDNIIADYARNVFRHISHKTKKFVEECLITHDEKRTMYALSDIKSEKIKGELNTLYSNSDLRYINRVEYFGTAHVEVLHDRLVKPLLLSRLSRRRLENYAKILAGIILPGVAAYFLFNWIHANEMDKIARYNTFFTEDKATSIASLRKQVNELDTLNTIEPLRAILHHTQSIQDLPVYKQKGIFAKSLSLTAFYDSVVQIYREKDLVTKLPEGFGDQHSSQYRFLYNISKDQVNIISKGPAKDSITIWLKKYTATGFVPYAFIRLGKAQDIESFSSENIFFSDNDSLVAIQYAKTLTVFDLSRISKDSSALKIYKENLTATDNYYSFFSSDSKHIFLQNSKGNYIYHLKQYNQSVLPRHRSNAYYSTGMDLFSGKNNSLLLLSLEEYQENQNDRTNLSSNDYRYNIILTDLATPFKPLFLWKSLQQYAYYQLFYLSLNKNEVCFYYNDSVKVLNLMTSALHVLHSGLGKVYHVHYLQKKNQLLLIGEQGGVEVYNLNNFQLIKSRSFAHMLSSYIAHKEKIVYKNSFLSDDENLILINYFGNMEVYDITNDSIVNTYKKYLGPLSFARFNSNQTVDLIDDKGQVVRWFYQLKTIKNRDDLNMVYNYLNAYK